MIRARYRTRQRPMGFMISDGLAPNYGGQEQIARGATDPTPLKPILAPVTTPTPYQIPTTPTTIVTPTSGTIPPPATVAAATAPAPDFGTWLTSATIISPLPNWTLLAGIALVLFMPKEKH